MPYKSDKYALRDFAPSKDRRKKLTPEDKEEIKARFARGEGLRPLGRAYSVTHRMIGLIVHQEYRDVAKKWRDSVGGSKHFYKKEKHTISMKKHRHHKNALFKIHRPDLKDNKK